MLILGGMDTTRITEYKIDVCVSHTEMNTITIDIIKPLKYVLCSVHNVKFINLQENTHFLKRKMNI